MVKAAIEVSKDWLAEAKSAFKAGRFELSLYSMEMSIEIAFKAVLISINVDVPKVHDIRETVAEHLSENKRLPKEFLAELDGYISVFKILLSLRSMVGYGFEGDMESKNLEKQCNNMIPKCTKIVGSCEKAIKKIG